MRNYNFCEGGRALRIAFGTLVLVSLLIVSAQPSQTSSGGGADAINISSCTTISEPGTYVLNKNIIDSGASSCINITSSNVVFDGAYNLIDGKDIWNTHGVYVYNSTKGLKNITIQNLEVTDWGDGINYRNALNGSINNITANSDILFGINLSYSSNNNLLIDNKISYNGNGIQLWNSNNNELRNNNVSSNNLNNIYLMGSSNNRLNGNTALNSIWGIILFFGNFNNIISGNTVLGNNYGVYLHSSSSNTIYNNYFNNTNNAYDDGNNIWNITKTAGTNIIGGLWLGGNNWSDYAGKDLNGDGLGDTLLPYNSLNNITNNGDYLPLTIAPIPMAGSISGYKINDTNGNGKWNAGESGIQGWNITLKNTTTGAVIASNLTDTTGFYNFDNLPAGRYFVIEKLKKGFVPTSSPVKRIRLAQGKNSLNNNFTNRPRSAW